MINYLPYSLLALLMSFLCVYSVNKNQTSKYINVNKIFIYIIILIFLPIVLIKPDIYIFDIKTNYRSLFLPSEDTIKQTILVYSLMCFSIALSNFYTSNFFKENIAYNDKIISFSGKKNFFDSYCIVVYLLLILVTVINYKYRILILSYILGNFDYNQVNELRRFQNFDLSIINTFRYNLIFIHILFFSLIIKKRFGYLAFSLVYFFSIILISGNISKLYYVFSLSVFAVASLYTSEKKYLLYDNKIFLKITSASLILVLSLGLIYSFVEHSGDLRLIDGLKLGFYRIFASSFNDMAYFIDVFPNDISFTYFRQSSLLSGIFSLDFMPIGEMLIDTHIDLYGKSTTVASFFVSYAWAFGGYPFVIIFSFLLSFLLKYLDFKHRMIKNEIIRITFYSFIICSPLINLQASFFTSLLHYGLLLGPMYMLFLDRVLINKDK